MVVEGDGITVTGTGAKLNPYVVTSNVSDIKTGIAVQYNNVDVIRDVHRLDFRGAAVHIDPGTDEAVVTVTVPDPTTGAIIPTGAIWMFGMSNPPAGWLPCNGATNLLIATYPALFAAIGTNFGGDGITTFGVPNMNDRFPVGASALKPINGVPGGAASVSIGVANLPPHAHSIDHNHPAKNSSTAGGHDHDIISSATDGNNAVVRRGAGSTQTGGGPIEQAPGHQHSVDLGNYVGSTSSTPNATGAPLSTTPPYQAMAFAIKT